MRRFGHQRQTNGCNVTPVTSLCWSELFQRLHQHLHIESGAFFSFWMDFDAHPTVAQNRHAKASFCQKHMRTLSGTERSQRTRLAYINLGGDQSRHGCGNARKRVGCGRGAMCFYSPVKNDFSPAAGQLSPTITLLFIFLKANEPRSCLVQCEGCRKCLVR